MNHIHTGNHGQKKNALCYKSAQKFGVMDDSPLHQYVTSHRHYIVRSLRFAMSQVPGKRLWDLEGSDWTYRMFLPKSFDLASIDSFFRWNFKIIVYETLVVSNIHLLEKICIATFNIQGTVYQWKCSKKQVGTWSKLLTHLAKQYLSVAVLLSILSNKTLYIAFYIELYTWLLYQYNHLCNLISNAGKSKKGKLLTAVSIDYQIFGGVLV